MKSENRCVIILAVMEKIFTIKLSHEQNKFIQMAIEGNNILVDACIGSGKTTAIQYLCNELPSHFKILYLTYSKLLKIDAQAKIKKKNVYVTNYHAFAWSSLDKNKKIGVSDLIQEFNKVKPKIECYDVLIIDEYQDIRQEYVEMLEYIKSINPTMQIIAVGDMRQKICDVTLLDVPKFMDKFLGVYAKLEFTNCFRLSADWANTLGRIWNKTINGVNKNCVVEKMDINEVINFLSYQDTRDILCLGANNGDRANVLNILEKRYPYKFNKNTVYSRTSDNIAEGATSPTETAAIFTTFDSSKGLERKICVVFDFTESYWGKRINKPQQSYEILRNIFCVAASRGKERIIFVEDDGDDILSEETLKLQQAKNNNFENVDISSMFDFKYDESVEDCYKLLEITKKHLDDRSEIKINHRDGLIDLSSCIGIYQEAVYFRNYDIDKEIEQFFHTHPSIEYLYDSKVKKATLNKKILYLVSFKTNHERYIKQVRKQIVNNNERQQIISRLNIMFTGEEEVQVPCMIGFANSQDGDSSFCALGLADVVKDKIVYELKFVSELEHKHFLQCACYMIALKLETGILWNTRNNVMYEIKIPERKVFMDSVVNAVTKGNISKYYEPNKNNKLCPQDTVKCLR